MAISWDTQITNVNTNSQKANISFTRREPGNWKDATAYVVDDIIAYESIVYKCLADHTSVRGAGIGLGGEPDTNTSQWSVEVGETQSRWSIPFNQTSLATPDRIPLMNTVWAEWQKELTKLTVIENFISNLEQVANANLEARET